MAAVASAATTTSLVFPVVNVRDLRICQTKWERGRAEDFRFIADRKREHTAAAAALRSSGGGGGRTREVAHDSGRVHAGLRPVRTRPHGGRLGRSRPHPYPS